jgi:UDP-N-acetylglucosamine 1-carboxyvinyltransferase
MSRIVIQGGYPLKGSFTASGNKNAAIPIIAASLMIDGQSIVKNVPGTIDVLRIIEQMELLGCHVTYKNNILEFSLPVLKKTRFGKPVILPPQINLLLVASILQMEKKVTLDNIDMSKERIDTHVEVLRAFNILIEENQNFVEFSRPSVLEGKRILLSESSVTATELAILLAVKAEGKSHIYNAACEPHVQDFINYLNSCGAQISGGGSNLIVVDGVKKLSGNTFDISEDYIEIGSLIAMAAMTRGDVLINCTRKDWIQPILLQYKKMGVEVQDHADGVMVQGDHQFEKDAKFIDNQSTISSSPFPNYPSDLIPMSIVMATQSHGAILIHEKLYSSRMYFVDNLVYMGANIVQCDPHRVVVTGPTKLYPTVWESPDIRTGLASLGAGVICSGEMIIDDVQVINRVFENMVGKLRLLGAQIGEG